ncbi:MAG: metallophosphoesterase, partial [Planctomycetota bacterium]
MTPRTFVVGDIHGCSTALEAVLCASGFAGNDILITLGDMIDRGPNTRGVLDFLMRLLGERRLIPIRGNHEVMMQHALDSGRDSQWFASGGLQTLESFGLASNKAWRSCLPMDYRSFIVHDCVDYWEDERFIFTHAGLEAGLGLADQPHSTLF